MTTRANAPRKTPTRRLASIADAADYAACSGKTIRRRIADGTIPAYRPLTAGRRQRADDGRPPI